MSDTFQSFQELTESKVDRANGILKGVCMLEIGEARGHDIWIDQTTLETALECANKFSKGLKVKFRHSKAGEYQSVLEEAFGTLKNCVIKGAKLIGDLHLLKALDEKIKEKAFEMAEDMADQFGLSIDFKGTTKTIEGKKFLRCTSLNSTDLTDKPAATSGLFSMNDIKYEAGTSGKHAKDCKCSDCTRDGKMEELAAGLKSLTELVGKLAEKATTVPTPPAASGSLEYRDKDGKTQQLSAEAIVARLEAADKLVTDAKAAVEKNERKTLVQAILREGRVVMNPDTGVAYKLEELEKLDVGYLKFAAKNAPVVPTQARLTYTSTGDGPMPTTKFTRKDKDGKDVPLKGEELLAAEFETAFPSLNAAIAAQNHNLTQN